MHSIPWIVFTLKYPGVIDALIFTKRTMASDKVLRGGERKWLNKDLFLTMKIACNHAMKY
jgi:hypothetical protein